MIKVCAMVLFERLQKYLIYAQIGTKRQSLNDIVEFIIRTAKQDCVKSLGRSLEEDLMRIEDCAHVNILFEDRGTN